MISERVARPSLSLPSPLGGLRSALALVSRPLTVAALAAVGMLGVGLLWAAVAAWVSKDLPGPVSTLRVFWHLVSDPFYDSGPNDKGIGLQLLASLKRVLIGFGAGTLIAVPLGVLIGTNQVMRRIMDPVVQILRPVSPLAWFPIGLVVFQSAPHAAIFIICITSIWPTILNTAFGAGSVPAAHKNVARVFQFSKRQYFFRVVIPYSLPYIFTGMRLSMGIAWMVIVAGEMLSGGTGIGFFVWDSWNALNLERVMAAILLIGIVGLFLDRAFALLTEHFSYTEAA